MGGVEGIPEEVPLTFHKYKEKVGKLTDLITPKLVSDSGLNSYFIVYEAQFSFNTLIKSKMPNLSNDSFIYLYLYLKILH